MASTLFDSVTCEPGWRVVEGGLTYDLRTEYSTGAGSDCKRSEHQRESPVGAAASTRQCRAPPVRLGDSSMLATSTRIAILCTLCAPLLAAPVLAQAAATGAAGAQAAPDPSEALIAEYQETQQRLGQLQVQAIQENSELEDRRSAIDDLVTAAIFEINPAAEAHMARLGELNEQATAAQQAQDMEALQSLMTEAMGLRSELDAAQAEAIQRPDVRAQIESFETDLMAVVVEIDPEAMSLETRLEELAEVLSASGPGDP